MVNVSTKPETNMQIHDPAAASTHLIVYMEQYYTQFVTVYWSVRYHCCHDISISIDPPKTSVKFNMVEPFKIWKQISEVHRTTETGWIKY